MQSRILLFLSLMALPAFAVCELSGVDMESRIAIPQDLAILDKVLGTTRLGQVPLTQLQEAVRNGKAVVREFDEAFQKEAGIERFSAYSLFEKDLTYLLLPNQKELGLVLIEYFHEMTHVLDVDFAKQVLKLEPIRSELEARFERGLSPSEQSVWVTEREAYLREWTRAAFQAERKAYDAQYALIQELISQDTCVKDFYSVRAKQRKIIIRKMDDASVARTSGLNPNLL